MSGALAALDLSTVDGWLTDGQAAMLADAASRCGPDGEIVEIGSFRGRSTIVLAAHAPDGVGVVAIDPHAGNDRGPQERAGFADEAAADRVVFEENLAAAGVRHRVRHVPEFSDRAHDAVSGPIAVLYIDGAHRYRPARSDIRDWGARVADGGELLIHDGFASVGVTLAIVRELMFGRRFRYVGRSRSLVRYRADLGRSGAGERVANAARQAAQIPWFARNIVLKVLLLLGLGKIVGRLGRTAPEWPY